MPVKKSARKTAAKPAKRPAKASPKKASRKAPLPKSEGGAGVRAYIATLPGWQAKLARRLDALVGREVPGVRKAIKWHVPLYGVAGQGWFLSFAGFSQHFKVSFFRGAELAPVPPNGESKLMRSIDLQEGDPLDERQMADWIRQASSMPGWGSS